MNIKIEMGIKSDTENSNPVASILMEMLNDEIQIYISDESRKIAIKKEEFFRAVKTLSIYDKMENEL